MPEKKKILITGEGSFIGSSVEGYLKRNCFEEKYQVDTIDMRGNGWRSYDFTGYDTVFHVAGIAHADVGKVTEEGKKLYYQVNCDLAEEAACPPSELSGAVTGEALSGKQQTA